MRKHRSDSKLFGLPQEQQDKIIEWMQQGLSYPAILELCRTELNVSTSTGALSNFWDQVASMVYMNRRTVALGFATDIAAVARENPGCWEESAIEALQQRTFEVLTNPQMSPKDVKQFVTLFLTSQKQTLESRRISVLEQRAAEMALEQVQAIGVIARDGDLSTPEKVQRTREILFGSAIQGSTATTIQGETV